MDVRTVINNLQSVMIMTNLSPLVLEVLTVVSFRLTVIWIMSHISDIRMYSPRY